MEMKPTQVPERVLKVIEEQTSIYQKRTSITRVNSIPDQNQIPLDNPVHWIRIPSVICVYVDMVGSTRLSASEREQDTARAYQLFTGTAVRLFAAFNAAYIDVKGDGVFALFDAGMPNTALAAAVTFKSFAELEFVQALKRDLNVDLGAHIGIDEETVLVRKIGMRRVDGRYDRQNEVWAGKPVNMAAKLASLSKSGQLLASDRFFQRLKDEKVLRSCGCPSGQPLDLWERIDVKQDARFDFESAWLLKTRWCDRHGAEFCSQIIGLDRIDA
ncbi:MAG: adenylate/guanylate cyclase domain-containing protein [Acidobacteria bacterium]|nr:adenylate/guanylate cyclase domain-containing protein [Acidobacteriota bacterium]